MRHRLALVSGGVTVATAAALALAGCTSGPVTTAVLGIGRGGQRAEILGIVVVCSGEVNGLELATEDAAPLMIGDGLRRITRWVAPEAVIELGATDLVGDTVWRADTEIARFYPGVDYSLGAVADGGSVLARPIVFQSEQFDTLSVGEIIVGDIRDGTSETVSVESFLSLACRPD